MIKKMLVLLLLCQFTAMCSQAGFKSTQEQFIEHKNIVINGGFENGKQGWSEVGGGTFAINTTAANVGSGKAAGSFDAAASSDELLSPLSAINPNLAGALCEARISFKGGDANLIFKVNDGSSDIITKTLAASTNYTQEILRFTCVVSTSYRVEIEATADAAIIFIDDVYIGLKLTDDYGHDANEQVKLYGALLNCSGSSTVAEEIGGDWVASVTNISSGSCVITYTTAFAVRANCTLGGFQIAGDIFSLLSGNTTTVTVNGVTHGGVSKTSYSVYIQCMQAQ